MVFLFLGDDLGDGLDGGVVFASQDDELVLEMLQYDVLDSYGGRCNGWTAKQASD